MGTDEYGCLGVNRGEGEKISEVLTNHEREQESGKE
jgi:hypothetical protein